MPRNRNLDPFRDRPVTFEGPARDWYVLTNGDIGVDLPTYGRSLMIFVQDSFSSFPLTIEVLPVAQAADTPVRPIPIPRAGVYTIPYGIRQVVTVEGGNTIPSGVQIDVVTG